MEERDAVIRASCPLYACRFCRTKTGWPHQLWCVLELVTEPDCEDCRYLARGRCAHPARRKGGVLRIETQRSF